MGNWIEIGDYIFKADEIVGIYITKGYYDDKKFSLVMMFRNGKYFSFNEEFATKEEALKFRDDFFRKIQGYEE